MSIRTRQLKRFINGIIESELKAGRIPTYELIMMRLRSLLVDWQPGTPTMVIRSWIPDTRCNVAELNATLGELHDDLTDLYDESGDISERILLNFRKSQLERDALRTELAHTEDNLLALLMTARDVAGLCRYYVETFPDTDKINLTNSTAIIDLEAGAVRLPYSAPPSIVPLTADMISVSASHAGLEELAPITNALDGKANTAWLVRLPYHAGEQHAVTLSIRWGVNLGFVPVNNLLLQCHMAVMGDIHVRFHTAHGWVTIDKPHITSKTMTYSFDDLEADSMEISIVKQEPDDYSGGGWCVFGFNNILCSYHTYAQVAEYVSRPVTFDRPIRQIALDAATSCPHNTSIDFYIACSDDMGSILWHPIGLQADITTTLPRTIRLESIDSQHVILDLRNINKYSFINGVQYYGLGAMPPGTILSSASLRLGYRQVAYMTFSTNEPRHSTVPVPALFCQQTITTIEEHRITSSLRCQLHHAPIASVIQAKFTQHTVVNDPANDADSQTILMEIELAEEDYIVDKENGSIYLVCLESDDIIIEDDATLSIRYNYSLDDSHTQYITLTPDIMLPTSQHDRYCYGRISVCLEATDYQTILFDSIKAANEGINFALYANGQKISSAIYLTPGSNNIDLLVCVDRETVAATCGDDMPTSFDLGLLYNYIASSIFYATPDVLRYVHPEVMFSDILPEDHSTFTVTDNTIVINMEPNMQAALLEYQSVNPSNVHYSVIVKAVLQRRSDKTGITPKLESYTVVVS